MMLGEFGRAVQTHAFLRGYTHFFETQKTRKHITDYADNIVFFAYCSYLRCFISFHRQCKRMRFYMVFAGTCIL